MSYNQFKISRVIEKHTRLSSESKDIKKEVIKLFTKNPPKSDKDIHNLANKFNIDPDKLEEVIYSIVASIFNSGKYINYKGPKFDEDQVKKGIKVELEHTSDPDIAERITRDHLSEIPNYYDLLEDMESKALANKKEAMDFSSVQPVITPKDKLNDRELARSIRLAIAAEHDAAHLYELMADATNNTKATKVLQSIANEEKVHVGELQGLLDTLDKDNERLLEEGKKEISEI